MWEEDVLLTLQNLYHNVEIASNNPHFIISIGRVSFHLVPLKNTFAPNNLLDLQQTFASQNQLLIHLWEDVWAIRRKQVLSRIHSFLQKNQTIHGRKTKVSRIDGNIAKTFFNEHHLQGFARCKLYLGLYLKEELVAVAGFGAVRLMTRKIPQQKSMELIRFATKSGFTIVGGLGKLLGFVSSSEHIDDIMTYADRDWSIGNGYNKLGFNEPVETEPMYMYVNTDTLKRYPLDQVSKKTSINFEEEINQGALVRIFNTGNLKYHYSVKR